MQQLPLDILPPPAPGFANFEAGPNAEALMVARALAAGSQPARTVLFWGPPGCGKSHLLTALARAQPRHRWLQATRLSDFALAAAHTPDPACPDDPMLLLAENPHEWPADIQQAFFLLLNQLRACPDVTLVLAAPQPPDGLAMRDDLRTRLASGLVIGMQLLSDSDKKQALLRHAHDRGLAASEPLINWLLAHRDRDIRALMAWLDALDRYALATRRPLSLRLLQDFERNGGQAAGA